MATGNKKKLSEVILRYAVDPNAYEKAVAAQQKLIAGNEGVKDSINDVSSAGVAYEQYISGTARGANEAERFAEAQERHDAIAKRLKDTLLDQYRAQKALVEEAEVYDRILADINRKENVGTGQRPNRQQGGSRGISVSERIDRVGTSGTQLLGGLGGSQAANAVGVVGDLANTLGTLGIVGSVAGGLMVGLAAGMGLVNSQTADLTRTFRAALAAQQIYYDAFENLTTEQVQDRVGELENQNRRIRAELDNIDAAFGDGVDVTERRLAELGNTLGNDLSGAALEAIGRHDELTQQLETNQQAIGRLNTGLQQNAFLANDAAEANEEYNRVLEERKSQFDQDVQAARDRINLENMTADQLRERRTQAQQDLLALQTAFQQAQDEGRVTNEIFAAWRDGSRALNTEIRDITDNLLPEAIQREAERNQVLKGSIPIIEGLTAAERARMQVAERTSSAKVQELESDKKAAEIKKQSADEKIAIEKDLAVREAEINTDSNRKLLDLVDSYNTDRQRRDEDTVREEKKINRDASRRLKDAIANRNSIENKQAKEDRQERLGDLMEASRVESRRRAEDVMKRLQQVRDEGSRILQLERSRAAQRISDLMTAAQQELSTLAAVIQQRQALEDEGYANALRSANTFATDMAAIFRNAFNTKTGFTPTQEKQLVQHSHQFFRSAFARG